MEEGCLLLRLVEGMEPHARGTSNKIHGKKMEQVPVIRISLITRSKK
jgi:hypothetical protein